MADNEGAFGIDEMLCFAVYAASRELTRLYRPTLEKVGLTYPQYLVMVMLRQHGESSVTDIGEKLLLDSGTLTPLLKRLQEAGLIYRRRSQGDERKVEVGLSEQGLALSERIKDVSKDLFTELCKTEERYFELLNSARALLRDAHELARRE
ncbi:DNA-binding transcriptional regulator, MarR family [Paenibacillus sp. UNC496MF]|uniref:MarR family winged helix-turn-helix transcriptional regulator n=1 Tax=Paenibacillus sp. UNC496MF TaxID=1502753 RepID=UPI0008EB48BD|nr:MarR family transcriptional regulator [Paenibacillus sp. UNC496MF]SFI36658.1 DNA-binding transcriptional regulator, MarR family [Paenibacillus sp. UNC496MF]